MKAEPEASHYPYPDLFKGTLVKMQALGQEQTRLRGFTPELRSRPTCEQSLVCDAGNTARHRAKAVFFLNGAELPGHSHGKISLAPTTDKKSFSNGLQITM